MDNNVSLVVFLDFPPLNSPLKSVECPKDLEMWKIAMAVARSVVKYHLDSGFCRFFKEVMNYYHLRSESFIDPNNSLEGFTIEESDVIIISPKTDKKLLNSLLEVRKATPFEMAAREIKSGR